MFVGFMLVVAVGYVPAFLDADGNLFGLFKLDLYDDSLHFFSGLWAGVAAWWSRAAARTYFRLFGPLYFADGVMGLFLGSGYLDGGIFLYGPIPPVALRECIRHPAASPDRRHRDLGRLWLARNQAPTAADLGSLEILRGPRAGSDRSIRA